MSAAGDFRAELAQKASDAGFLAVTDPAKVVPPCVLVDVPVYGETLGLRPCSVNVTVPVFVVARGPAGEASLGPHLDMVEALIPILRADRSDPTLLEVGTNQYPAYELTITRPLRLNPSEGS